MAIKLLAVNDVENERMLKYIVDIETEKNDIPDSDKVQGTEIFVVQGGKTYRMNSNLEWVEKEV